eukprot:4421456-Lingulodinium_polyedra.AAC.1
MGFVAPQLHAALERSSEATLARVWISTGTPLADAARSEMNAIYATEPRLGAATFYPGAANMRNRTENKSSPKTR